MEVPLPERLGIIYVGVAVVCAETFFKENKDSINFNNAFQTEAVLELGEEIEETVVGVRPILFPVVEKLEPFIWN